jgi:hypothetical protein
MYSLFQVIIVDLRKYLVIIIFSHMNFRCYNYTIPVHMMYFQFIANLQYPCEKMNIGKLVKNKFRQNLSKQ